MRPIGYRVKETNDVFPGLGVEAIEKDGVGGLVISTNSSSGLSMVMSPLFLMRSSVPTCRTIFVSFCCVFFCVALFCASVAMKTSMKKDENSLRSMFAGFDVSRDVRCRKVGESGNHYSWFG